MKNLNALFEVNQQHSCKIHIQNKKFIFECKDKIFSGDTILKVINFVNTLQIKYRNVKAPLIFSFGQVTIADKLSYILFECICYFVIKEYHQKIILYIDPVDQIDTTGIFSSSLPLLSDVLGKNMDKFIHCFEMEIYRNHFRRLIKGEEKEKTNYLGNLLQELDTFLKFFNIIEENRDEITEVIAELVGNACEHGHTDCLLDIDIADNYSKSVENIPQKGNFYGINIAIVNFSNILLGDGINEKIKNDNLNEERYIDLKRAYNFHKSLFTKDYSHVDFCNISSLQDKISGRPNYILSGGTGLTKLIHSLQEKSDMNSCYVISGDRCVRFVKDLINYDKNNWLGFNKQMDFFSAIPDKEVITGCYIYLPGTAYNLNFIMKREESDYENNSFKFS